MTRPTADSAGPRLSTPPRLAGVSVTARLPEVRGARPPTPAGCPGPCLAMVVCRSSWRFPGRRPALDRRRSASRRARQPVCGDRQIAERPDIHGQPVLPSSAGASAATRRAALLIKQPIAQRPHGIDATVCPTQAPRSPAVWSRVAHAALNCAPACSSLDPRVTVLSIRFAPTLILPIWPVFFAIRFDRSRVRKVS
jgi:hypothetical protein